MVGADAPTYPGPSDRLQMLDGAEKEMQDTSCRVSEGVTASLVVARSVSDEAISGRKEESISTPSPGVRTDPSSDLSDSRKAEDSGLSKELEGDLNLLHCHSRPSPLPSRERECGCFIRNERDNAGQMVYVTSVVDEHGGLLGKGSYAILVAGG